jgi:hypothetical protein
MAVWQLCRRRPKKRNSVAGNRISKTRRRAAGKASGPQIAALIQADDVLAKESANLAGNADQLRGMCDLAAPGHPRPRVITVDGNPSYPAVIQELKRAGALGRRCRCRPVGMTSKKRAALG